MCIMWKWSGQNGYRWCKVQIQTSKVEKILFFFCRKEEKLSYSGLGIARSSNDGTSRKSFFQVCIVQQDLQPASCSLVFLHLPQLYFCPIFASDISLFCPALPLFPLLYPSPPEALGQEVQHLGVAECQTHLLHFARLDATFGIWTFHQTWCYIWPAVMDKKVFRC